MDDESREAINAAFRKAYGPVRYTAAIAVVDVRPAVPDTPPARRLTGSTGVLEMIGPEHGMRGETTLCGLRRDDVMLMRHYWNIGSADSCDACKAALSSPKPGGALNAEPGTDVYVFPEPWWDLRGHGDRNGRMRQAIGAELARELVAGHPLHEEEVAAIARCKHCDDALFHLHDGRFARVHLSWHGPDRPPWPTSELLQSWAEVVAYAKSHSEEAGFT